MLEFIFHSFQRIYEYVAKLFNALSNNVWFWWRRYIIGNFTEMNLSKLATL